MPSDLLMVLLTILGLAQSAWALPEQGLPPDEAPHHVRTTTPSGVGIFLVDTGADPKIVTPEYMDCDQSARLFYRHNMRFVAPPARTIERQLRELGIAPEQVDTVVITHFHADHPGRLSAFPRARVLTGGRNLR